MTFLQCCVDVWSHSYAFKHLHTHKLNKYKQIMIMYSYNYVKQHRSKKNSSQFHSTWKKAPYKG